MHKRFIHPHSVMIWWTFFFFSKKHGMINTIWSGNANNSHLCIASLGKILWLRLSDELTKFHPPIDGVKGLWLQWGLQKNSDKESCKSIKWQCSGYEHKNMPQWQVFFKLEIQNHEISYFYAFLLLWRILFHGTHQVAMKCV